ncbi:MULTISPECIES: substrate import-associated zinc metallohydrolase lipoprotein [Butyricimonas]|mgnify:FL=1|uniref:Substrate import-associated zinc metallohydrolase lipoprotein n=1 Tax=Butyricimonas hominis TaxID=2763032 RepID=A0ABR7D3C9_9BACT|nr:MULTISPECIES: substrate import-associated zinc metallohydrolase lipoprotein [Butyricimonas]MBC5621870.1 hypothetical protein [Butyricimonas hominis]
MKKVLFSIIILISFQVLWMGCSENAKFDDTIYDIKDPVWNEVDTWIFENYVKPHNIEVLYRWKDIETETNKNLIPAQIDTIVPFLRMVKHGWIDTYLELCGMDVMNPVFPKQILLLGSAGWNEDGTKTQGTAEGGKKVVLYELEEYDPKNWDNVMHYIRVLHHEFTHILNQKKEYNLAFKQITPDTYSATWTGNSVEQARSLGFVTPYAMAEPGEDFAEVVAEYVTNTAESWEALLGKISNETGKSNILKKLDMVRTYLDESWGIDIDRLRELVNTAIDDVVQGNY